MGVSSQNKIKLKDVLPIIEGDIDIFYKGSYVSNITELTKNHWVLECIVTNISIECESICIFTRD